MGIRRGFKGSDRGLRAASSSSAEKETKRIPKGGVMKPESLTPAVRGGVRSISAGIFGMMAAECERDYLLISPQMEVWRWQLRWLLTHTVLTPEPSAHERIRCFRWIWIQIHSRVSPATQVGPGGYYGEKAARLRSYQISRGRPEQLASARPFGPSSDLSVTSRAF